MLLAASVPNTFVPWERVGRTKKSSRVFLQVPSHFGSDEGKNDLQLPRYPCSMSLSGVHLHGSRTKRYYPFWYWHNDKLSSFLGRGLGGFISRNRELMILSPKKATYSRHTNFARSD